MASRIFWILLLIAPFTYGNTLTIGTMSYDPPLSIKINEKNNFYGFDIDIMSEICKRIQATCNYKPFTFSQLFTAVDKREIDLAIASISISKEREQLYLFSSPYYFSQAQFVTISKSPISTLEALTGKRIGLIGIPTKELVLKLYKGDVTVIEYLDIPAQLNGLNQKEVDAVVIDKGVVQYWFANSDDLYKIILPFVNYGTGYGIMTNKDQSALINQVNDALQKMKADKTYDTIYAKYFG